MPEKKINKVSYGGHVLIDLTEDTVTENDVLSPKTFHDKAGQAKTGTIISNHAVDVDISLKNQVVDIPSGYHEAAGSVKIALTEQAKIIPENIREDIDILGQIGTLVELLSDDPLTLTPYTTEQTVTPSSGHNAIPSVTVNAISYIEEANAAGGTTVTIGTVAP